MIYKQIRIGQHNKPFYIYKFRTMNDKEQSTPFQTWLRRSGLDELPQLLNVLMGHMTLVGPRPLIPSDHEEYRYFSMPCKPGLTGWWQIHSRDRSRIFHYDVEYLELKKKLGWWLDLYILCRTVPIVLRGKHECTG